MTNELEKQFFDTFGIEPKYEDGTCDMDDKCRCTDCNTCQRINKFNYPQITDTHYLKLICILHTTNIVQLCTTNIEDLKEEILMTACYWFDKLDIKHQVRTLFEEG